MHELSICRAIADIAERGAQGRAVATVHVRVGHLRQVVPSTLQFCWPMAVDGTPLAGTELAVEHVPARLRCVACDSVTEISVPVLRCQRCEGVDTELLSGEELLVTSLDLAEADAGAR